MTERDGNTCGQKTREDGSYKRAGAETCATLLDENSVSNFFGVIDVGKFFGFADSNTPSFLLAISGRWLVIESRIDSGSLATRIR